MLEEVLISPALDEVLEELGNKTEAWANKWWWMPLRALLLAAPFIAIGIYYFWFL
jgi:hypothetical protein